jgi:hypothetical protein
MECSLCNNNKSELKRRDNCDHVLCNLCFSDIEMLNEYSCSSCKSTCYICSGQILKITRFQVTHRRHTNFVICKNENK